MIDHEFMSAVEEVAAANPSLCHIGGGLETLGRGSRPMNFQLAHSQMIIIPIGMSMRCRMNQRNRGRTGIHFVLNTVPGGILKTRLETCSAADQSAWRA
jgi:hypothetical protein